MHWFKGNFSKSEKMILLICSACLCFVYCLALEACGYYTGKAVEPKTEEKVAACFSDDDSCQKSNDQSGTETVFERISFQDAIHDFENSASGIYYFGFENCPWCQEVEPLIEEESKISGQTVHYIQTRDENGERLYTDEEKEQILPYLEDYMSHNEESGEWTLYVPLLVRIEEGRAVNGHVGTVEGHDAHERKMTEEESREVKRKVKDIFAEAEAGAENEE